MEKSNNLIGKGDEVQCPAVTSFPVSPLRTEIGTSKDFGETNERSRRKRNLILLNYKGPDTLQRASCTLLAYSSTQSRHEGLKEELNGPSLFDPVQISLFYL